MKSPRLNNRPPADLHHGTGIAITARLARNLGIGVLAPDLPKRTNFTRQSVAPGIEEIAAPFAGNRSTADPPRRQNQRYRSPQRRSRYRPRAVIPVHEERTRADGTLPPFPGKPAARNSTMCARFRMLIWPATFRGHGSGVAIAARNRWKSWRRTLAIHDQAAGGDQISPACPSNRLSDDARPPLTTAIAPRTVTEQGVSVAQKASLEISAAHCAFEQVPQCRYRSGIGGIPGVQAIGAPYRQSSDL